VISLLIGQYDDALSIILAVIIVSTVAFVQEYRSEKAVEALHSFVAQSCQVLRDGRVRDIKAEELVTGDIVVLNRGDRVPADIRLIETIDFRTDESILTGESEAVKKHHSRIDGDVASIADRKNMIFMGTMVAQGKGKGIVVAVGDDTELGKISHMIQNTEEHKTPLQLKMDQLGKHLTMTSFGIIAIIFIFGFIQGNPLLEMFNVGVSLAVAAIPEGLPIVVTVTLALGVTRMAKRHAIVRKLPAVEALGSVSVICVDKTGTLTQNKMTVSKLFTTTHIESKVSNLEGRLEFLNENGVRFDSKHDSHLQKLLKIGIYCNNASYSYDHQIGNPTEVALLSCAFQAGLEDLRKFGKRIDEIPFDSEKKWMAVRCDGEEGLKYYVKGALEVVLPKCKNFYDNNQNPLETKEACSKLSNAGLRVLALAYGDDLNSLTFVGLVGIHDPPRFGVKESVLKTRDSGVKIVMITGDSKDTAISIATELGMYDRDSTALSAEDIENLSEAQLANKLDKVAVFYRMSPSLKMKIVQAYRVRGDIVAMTGDGVNDAPALKASDIGIAMGKGSDVCKEASEIILVDNNFATIAAAMEDGKGIFSNIQNFLRFQLSTSLAALSMIAYCTLHGSELPLNPMQILWINIIMDGPPAQSLGLEPVSKDAMKQPPRHPQTPVITRRMVTKILQGAAIMVIGTLFVFFHALEDGVEEQRYATTLAFTTFVMFQMFNALNCRSATQSVMAIGFFSNNYFLFAIGGSIVMQLLVIYIPWLNYAFETVPLGTTDLLYTILVASLVFLADELLKFLKIQS